VTEYPWSGNWLYTAQRWTGGIAFAYIVWHTWHLRFTGVHLLVHPAAAFGKVQQEFQNPLLVVFYVVGIVAASWHFCYGLWLFCAKWGITVGERARRRFGYVCFALAVIFMFTGLASMYAFLYYPRQPLDAGSTSDSIVRLMH
jgi:succinate dehydrogenase / fumarate reductase cytochrome b subunit